MNQIYRLVFNRPLGLFQVAPEIMSAHGKMAARVSVVAETSSSSVAEPESRLRHLVAAIALALGALPSSLTWAEACSSSSTTISGAVNDTCSLDGSKTLTVNSFSSLTTSSYYNVTYSGTGNSVVNNGTISSTGQAIATPSPTSATSFGLTLLINNGQIIGGYAAIGNFGGTITELDNSGAGYMSATQAIFSDGTITTLNNAGALTGSAAGIENASGGTIGALTNIGSITTTSTGNTGAINNDGAITTLHNASGGTISGPSNAVYNSGFGTITTLNNEGTISASSGVGIYNELRTDPMMGSHAGHIGAVTNSGTISGTTYGIQNMATIDSIVNSGTISGGTYAVYNNGTITNGITNSGIIDGKVELDAAALALNGTSGRVTGAVTGLGSSAVTVNGTFTTENTFDVGSFTIANAGTLNMAHGITTANGFTNSGTLAVADGVTATITGNFTNTGTFNTSVASSSSYGKLNISGTANLGGTLNVNVLGAPALSGSLAGVIHAGSISGTFASVTDNSALFDFTPVYSGTNVDLAISTTDTGPTVEQIVRHYDNTPAIGAARVLDTVFANNPNGALAAAFVPVSSSDAQINHAVTQTLPLLTGGSLLTTQNTLLGINHVIRARQDSLNGMSSGDGFLTERNFWLKPFGSRANQDDHNGVAGFDANTWGLALGVDGEVNKDNRVGVAFAYAKANVDDNSSVAPQSVDVDVYQLIGYGTHNLGGDRKLSYQLDVGHNQNDGVRKMSDFSAMATSSYGSASVHAGAGVTQMFALSQAWSLIPGLRADYTWIHDSAYSESGAGVLNLDVNDRSAEQFVIAADSKLEYRFDNHLAAAVNLGVGYDTMAGQASITSAYAGAPGAAFVTYGLEPDAWLYQAGVGVRYEASDTLDVSVRYDAEMRTGFDNQTASIKMNWKF